MPQIARALLVDDNQFDNEFHEREIRKTGLVGEVVAFERAEQALAYLRGTDGDEPPSPELIFLDINMPAMNGWEFLEEYGKLPEACRKHSVVLMLSTSVRGADLERATANPLVRSTREKPLTATMLEELVAQFGPDDA